MSDYFLSAYLASLNTQLTFLLGFCENVGNNKNKRSTYLEFSILVAYTKGTSMISGYVFLGPRWMFWVNLGSQAFCPCGSHVDAFKSLRETTREMKRCFPGTRKAHTHRTEIKQEAQAEALAVSFTCLHLKSSFSPLPFKKCTFPTLAFPAGSDDQESACDAGDPGSILGSKVPWRGHDNPLQYPCLESPMDTEAWRATVQGAAQSRTRQRDQHTFPPLTLPAG